MTLLSLPDALAHLEHHEAVWVCVVQAEGSVPREVGAWMLVWSDAVAGSIGGGQLEFQAIAQARARLAQAPDAVHESVHRYPLGPSLGQCCGGVVHLRFERVGAADTAMLAQRLLPARHPLALFGGGHVGGALVRVLAPLPFAITWIDSRNEIFPPDCPPQVRCEHSDPVQAAVTDLAPGSRVLVMSFSHAEDLDIVAACLRRQRERGDLAFLGLIGSKTKWATFRHRLADRGYTDAELAQVTCPIGLPGIAGKQPEVIAVAVAAQLLQLP
jgi:xanthine dehydrogenase accessory factor